MNTAERVVDFYRRNQGQPFCDDCVAARLGVRGSLTRMIGQLNAAYYRREETLCSHCGARKPTSMLVPGHFPPPRTRKRPAPTN